MGVLLRTRKLKNGKKSYYLDINHNGQRYREFLNAKIKDKLGPADREHAREIKKIALAIRNQREKELITDGFEVSDLIKSNICFTTYFELYAQNYSKADKRKVEAGLKRFKEHFGKIKIRSLKHKNCEGYLQYLYNHPGISSDETVRSYFGVFRKVLNEAIREEIINDNPTKAITVKKIRSKLNKQVLTIEEIQLLANTNCGNQNVKNAFIFSLNTGLGLSELRKLQWKHINNNKLSHFKRSKTDTPLTIPLNSNAAKVIGKRKGALDYVFNLPSTNGCNKALKYWVKRAGIEKHITWYCARHSYACNLLLHGANSKTVANLLGHTTVGMIDKYLNFVSELNEQAVENLPEIEIA